MEIYISLDGNIDFFGMEIQGVLAAETHVEGLEVTSRSGGPPFYQMSQTELFIPHKIFFFFGNILTSLNIQITITFMITMPIQYFMMYVLLSFVFQTVGGSCKI